MLPFFYLREGVLHMKKAIKKAKKLNNTNQKNIMEAYSKAYSDIYKKLQFALNVKKNPQFKNMSIYQINMYVKHRLAQLEAHLKGIVPSSIDTAMEGAYALSTLAKYKANGITLTFEEALLEAHSEMSKGVSEPKGARVMDIISRTLYTTEHSISQLTQKTYSKHLTVQTLQNQGRENLADSLTEQLSGDRMDSDIYSGMTAIIDSAGRRWNSEVYVDMAIETNYHEAYTEGQTAFVLDNNGECDLAMIPFVGSVDECQYFEGLLISLTGATEGYRTYDELEATGLIFHPNCRHECEPFYDFSEIPDEVIQDQERVNAQVDELLG